MTKNDLAQLQQHCNDLLMWSKVAMAIEGRPDSDEALADVIYRGLDCVDAIRDLAPFGEMAKNIGRKI